MDHSEINSNWYEAYGNLLTVSRLTQQTTPNEANANGHWISEKSVVHAENENNNASNTPSIQQRTKHWKFPVSDLPDGMATNIASKLWIPVWQEVPLENTHKFFEIQEFMGPWLLRNLRKGRFNKYFKTYFLEEPYFRIITSFEPKKELGYSLSKGECVDMLSELEKECEMYYTHPLDELNEFQILNCLTPVLGKLFKQEEIQPMLKEWTVLDSIPEQPSSQTIDLKEVMDELKKDHLKLGLAYSYQYVKPVPEELRCPTCLQPPVQPTMTPLYPNKVFCKWCLSFELDDQTSEKAEQNPAPEDITLKLDSLIVYCPFKNYGCDFTGARHLLDSHLEHCEYVHIVCLHKGNGCDFTAKNYQEVLKHVTSCKYQVKDPKANQPRNCRYCGIVETDVQNSKQPIPCRYHSGSWHSYSFVDVQNWRLSVMGLQVLDGVRTYVYIPMSMEKVKSTTAIGVSTAVLASIASATFPFPLVFLFLVPPSVTKSLVKQFYYFVYHVMWRNSYYLNYRAKPPRHSWTCCSQMGSHAAPCKTRSDHDFSDPPSALASFVMLGNDEEMFLDKD